MDPSHHHDQVHGEAKHECAEQRAGEIGLSTPFDVVPVDAIIAIEPERVDPAI